MDLLKKLGKYFIITLAILLVCSFVVLVDQFYEVEDDVSDVLRTYEALKYFFILGATAFTASVAYSIGIAALFAFNKLKIQTWKEFVRKLAAGLLLVIPLSAMVYYCDWFVYPQMKKTFATMKMKISDNIPEEIEYARKHNVEMSDILKEMPMLLPKARLTYKLDSLKNAFDATTDTCSMGVEPACASQPTASKDSLTYIQQELLYQYAEEAWRMENEILRLANEYSIRTRNTVGLYISYVLSALVIFLFRRYNPIRKILAVLAVLIVLSYMCKVFGEVVKEYIEDTRSIPQKVIGQTNKAVFNKHIKNKNKQ